MLSSWLQSVPFFSSMTFGIIALVIVGSSWSLTGLVMGDAPKQGIPPSFIQLLCGGLSLIGALAVAACNGTLAIPECSATAFWLTMAAYVFTGFSNFLNLIWMSRAMQSGPNGIIWAIIQSALVFPFIGGIIFFGVEATPLRIAGIILLLTALGIFSMAKDNSRSGTGGGNWKLLALMCLALCAVQQNITTIPSYFEECRKVPSSYRTMGTGFGTMMTALIYILFNTSGDGYAVMKQALTRTRLWMYLLGLSVFGLFLSITLLFPGLDVMAAHGLGGMAYPVMVGSCIVSFILACVFILKEKLRPVQLVALTLCITGLVLICTGPSGGR